MGRHARPRPPREPYDERRWHLAYIAWGLLAVCMMLVPLLTRT